MFWALIRLFSPAWDAVILTLKVGVTCPFVFMTPSLWILAPHLSLLSPYVSPSSTYSRCRLPAFYPVVIQLVSACSG